MKNKSFTIQKEKRRKHLLNSLPKGGRYVEVGVWRGGFSEQILDICEPEKLYLIDPWEWHAQWHINDKKNKEKGLEGPDTIYDEVCKKFSDDDRVEIIRLSSLDAIHKFQDESLDVVYIDGDHRYEGVCDDLSAWFPKIKPGGALCGDDMNYLQLPLHRHANTSSLTLRERLRIAVRAIRGISLSYIGKQPTESETKANGVPRAVIEFITELSRSQTSDVNIQHFTLFGSNWSIRKPLPQPKPNQQIKKVYHLHIPKTGGTTLNNLLGAHYQKEKIYDPKVWANRVRQMKKDGTWRGFSSFPYHEIFEQFDLIHDHKNFTKYLPRDFFKVVFLRDPISRVVSHFRDWRRLTDEDLENNPQAVADQKKATRDASLSDFILGSTNILTDRHFKNGLCKNIIGERVAMKKLNNPKIYNDELLFEEAKKVLGEMDFVGFMESYDTAVKDLCEQLGWEAPTIIPHTNIGSDRLGSMPEFDLEVVQKYHQADIRLYEYARNKYSQ